MEDQRIAGFTIPAVTVSRIRFAGRILARPRTRVAPLTAPLTRAMPNQMPGEAPQRGHPVNNGVKPGLGFRFRAAPAEAVTCAGAFRAAHRPRLTGGAGLTDLVTPYFETHLVLRQLRPFGPGERLREAQYPGGHMFYNRDDSRAAFLADARWLYGGE